MILDPDVFPLGPVSLIERLRGVDAAGRVAGEEGGEVGAGEGAGGMCHVRGLLGGNVPCVGSCAEGTFVAFMVVWLLMFDMRTLPARESITFDPIVYKVRHHF